MHAHNILLSLKDKIYLYIESSIFLMHLNVLIDSYRSKVFFYFLLLFIFLLISFSKGLNISLQHRCFL